MPAESRFRDVRWADLVRLLAAPAALAAAGLVVFTWMCVAVGDHDGITAVDGPVASWFAVHRGAGFDSLGLGVAKATSPVVLIALVVVAAALLWWRRLGFEAIVLTVLTATAYVTGVVIKIVEDRARPTAPIKLSAETDASFPSGHVLVVATIAFVAVVLVWRHLGRVGRTVAVLVAVAATVVMSLDRLVVGAHWLTDVVGSLALACVFGAIAIAVVRLRDLAAPPAFAPTSP